YSSSFYSLHHDTATPHIYTLSLHDALPISHAITVGRVVDTTQIYQLFKTEIGMITQSAHHREVIGGFDNDGHFTQRHRQSLKLFAQRVAQSCFQEFKFGRHISQP